MRLAVTEITRMSGGRNCIAAYAIDYGAMVRPLKSAREMYWTDEELDAFDWQVYGCYRVKPAGVNPPRGFPHRNEDLLIDPDSVCSERPLRAPSLLAEVRNTVASSLLDLFYGCLCGGRFVEEGADCPSLGAIELPRYRIAFFLNEFDKLRCRMPVGDGFWTHLPVVSKDFEWVQSDHHVDEIHEALEMWSHCHLRIGLAHPWEGRYGEYDPRRCYAMLNGLHVYNAAGGAP